MKFHMVCCKKLLKTRGDVFLHYRIVRRNGETRPIFICAQHGVRQRPTTCQNCFNSLYIARVEKTLGPDLMFSDYC